MSTIETRLDAASTKHYRWDDIPSEPLKGGLSRRLITSERMMIAHVYSKKGAPRQDWLDG